MTSWTPQRNGSPKKHCAYRASARRVRWNGKVGSEPSLVTSVQSSFHSQVRGDSRSKPQKDASLARLNSPFEFGRFGGFYQFHWSPVVFCSCFLFMSQLKACVFFVVSSSLRGLGLVFPCPNPCAAVSRAAAGWLGAGAGDLQVPGALRVPARRRSAASRCEPRRAPKRAARPMAW